MKHEQSVAANVRRRTTGSSHHCPHLRTAHPLSSLRGRRAQGSDIPERLCAFGAPEPARIGRTERAEDAFHLSPALSQREREMRPPRLDKSGRSSTSCRPTILTLPWGEGRGEGNGACPTT